MVSIHSSFFMLFLDRWGGKRKTINSDLFVISNTIKIRLPYFFTAFILTS